MWSQYIGLAVLVTAAVLVHILSFGRLRERRREYISMFDSAVVWNATLFIVHGHFGVLTSLFVSVVVGAVSWFALWHFLNPARATDTVASLPSVESGKT